MLTAAQLTEEERRRIEQFNEVLISARQALEGAAMAFRLGEIDDLDAAEQRVVVDLARDLGPIIGCGTWEWCRSTAVLLLYGRVR